MGLAKRATWALSCSFLSQFICASEIVAPEGCDKLPHSNYTKHDPTRPQPPKVETQGAITTPAPKDANILFNGKNLEAFQNRGNGPIKSKILEGGVLELGPGGLTSHEKFSDCQVHIEWRVPKENDIKGQKGSNSGIIFLDLFEIQILESHNNLTYADGHAGALYGEKPPMYNPSTPKGEWQSFDIYFKAPVYQDKKLVQKARVTVVHNGILIQNQEVFENASSYRKIKAYPTFPIKASPLQLKWDGDKVHFRNVWVRPLKSEKNTTAAK